MSSPNEIVDSFESTTFRGKNNFLSTTFVKSIVSTLARQNEVVCPLREAQQAGMGDGASAIQARQ